MARPPKQQREVTKVASPPAAVDASDFHAIARGLARAGDLLSRRAGSDPAGALRLAAGPIRLLMLQRESFASAADELDAAADGIAQSHVGLGFAVFKGMLQSPSKAQFAEAGIPLDQGTLAAGADALIRASGQVRAILTEIEEALRAPRPELSVKSEFPLLRGDLGPDSVAAGAGAVLLGSALSRLGERIAMMAEVLAMFHGLGLCPADECATPGMIDCAVVELRIITPVRMFSTYNPAGEFKLGEGAAADVLDALAKRMKSFLESGQISPEVAAILAAIFSGNLRDKALALIKDWLAGKIPITAVVDWIMAELGALSGATAAAIAAALAIALAMAAFSVAMAKIYARAITQPVNRGVLICAKVVYSMCVQGFCHRYIVRKEIELRISTRFGGWPDAGTGDLWTGAGGELGECRPEDLIEWQYLSDLIAELLKAIAQTTDPVTLIRLQAELIAARRDLAALAKASRFMREMTAQLSQSVCDALKAGDDLGGLALRNLTPCKQ